MSLHYNMNKKKGILLVTGGYYPEINGGGLQVRLIKNNLSNKFKAYVISFSNKLDILAKNVSLAAL